MVVAVIAMWVVKMAANAIIHVVVVRHRLVAAAEPMHMACLIPHRSYGRRCSGQGSRRIPRSRARRYDRGTKRVFCTLARLRLKKPPPPYQSQEAHPNSSSSAFASLRSAVPKPSLNQP